MLPVRFRSLGQYDYDQEVEVAADGTFRVSGGTYRSHSPRTGRLSVGQVRRLERALRALQPHAHPVPQGSGGFGSELEVGAGADRRIVSWWGPPPADDPALAEALAVLRAL